MLVCSRKAFDVTDSVEAVCQRNQNNAGIITHCKKHVTDCVRLMHCFCVYRKIQNLVYSENYFTDIFAELF